MNFSKIEWYEALEERLGRENRWVFGNAAVAVCGLGGLGSSVAIMLARCGIGKLILVDFDRVELTNIHRQQYALGQIGKLKTEAIAENIRKINPYVEIELHGTKLTEKNAERILSPANVVCEGFDCPAEKAKLVNFVLENMTDKYVVAASGMAGLCDPNLIKTSRISQKLFICGDGVNGIEKEKFLAAPRVMLCAAHQALTVLEILSSTAE